MKIQQLHHEQYTMRKALLVATLMLILTNGCSGIVFRETRQLGRFSQLQASKITNVISNLILQLANHQSYTAGRSFTYTFMVTNQFKGTVRLWFFSIGPSKNYFTCSVSPDHSMVLPYAVMQQEYWKIFSALKDQAHNGGFGSMMVVSKLLGIQYISWPGKLHDELWANGDDVTANISAARVEIAKPGLDDLGPNLGDCWPFSTSLISGYQTEGSYAFAAFVFKSKSSRYEALIKIDCNFVLYDYGEPIRYEVKPQVVWESNSAVKKRPTYCSISLQVDSNMVIAINYGRVQVVFASDRYCQPQPNCVRTAGLSVEDDGHVVVWETDSQTELWREPRV